MPGGNRGSGGKVLQDLVQWLLAAGRQLQGECEGGAVYQFGRQIAAVFLGGVVDVLEDPGQVLGLAGCGHAGLQGVLEPR